MRRKIDALLLRRWESVQPYIRPTRLRPTIQLMWQASTLPKDRHPEASLGLDKRVKDACGGPGRGVNEEDLE